MELIVVSLDALGVKPLGWPAVSTYCVLFFVYVCEREIEREQYSGSQV